MRTAADMLAEAIKTFNERGKVYKDNYRKVGKIMVALFPEGIMVETEEDWCRLHIFLLQIIKQTRYVSNWDRGHADSMRDLAVYAAMLEAIDEEINNAP